MTIKKILLVVFTLALLASVFVCGCAYAQSADNDTLEPWNVVADVVYGNQVYTYNLKQNILPFSEQASKRAFFSGVAGKKALCQKLIGDGLPSEAVYEYILPNFSDLTDFFSFVNTKKQDATVTFGKNGFRYFEGCDGVAINGEQLFEQLLLSCGRHITVKLPLNFDRALTVNDLKQNTVKKGTFTTTFLNSAPNRCHNIALATAALDGLTVQREETFSFNAVVGARTEQRGYKPSKVISDGVYTDGIGGGVCQVSTTLYNALLLSEIVPSAHQHTLVPTYVRAGFDAMVTYGGADLTFTNNTGQNLYISAKTDMSRRSVTFTVYGVANTYRVTRENTEERTPFSCVELSGDKRYPELIYTDQRKIICNGSDGVQSQSFLNFYLGEKLVNRQLIRKNSYKKVDMVVARGALTRPEQ